MRCLLCSELRGFLEGEKRSFKNFLITLSIKEVGKQLLARMCLILTSSLWQLIYDEQIHVFYLIRKFFLAKYWNFLNFFKILVPKLS